MQQGKQPYGELLVLGELPWWLLPRIKFLELPCAKAPIINQNNRDCDFCHNQAALVISTTKMLSKTMHN